MNKVDIIVFAVPCGVLLFSLLVLASYLYKRYNAWSQQQPFFLVHKPRSQRSSDTQQATSCWGRLAIGCCNYFNRLDKSSVGGSAAAQSASNTREVQAAVSTETDGQAELQPARATPELRMLYFSPPSLWSYVLEIAGMQGWTALALAIHSFLTLFAAGKADLISGLSPKWYNLFKFIVLAFPTLTLWVMIWQHAEVVLRKFMYYRFLSLGIIIDFDSKPWYKRTYLYVLASFAIINSVFLIYVIVVNWQPFEDRQVAVSLALGIMSFVFQTTWKYCTHQVSENTLMTVNQVINVAALDPALTSLCACDVVHETHLREHVLANLRLIVAKHGYLRTYYRMLFDGFLQLNNEVVTVKGKDGQPDTKMRTNLLRFEKFLRGIQLRELDLQVLRGKARRVDPADPPFWSEEQQVKLEFRQPSMLTRRKVASSGDTGAGAAAVAPDDVSLEEGGGRAADAAASPADGSGSRGAGGTAGQGCGKDERAVCVCEWLRWLGWYFTLVFVVDGAFGWLVENWADNMYACVMAAMVRNAPKHAHCFYPFAGDSYCMKILCNLLTVGTVLMLGFLAYAIKIALDLDALRGAQP